PRDVADRTVAVMSEHRDLLKGLPAEDAFARHDLQPAQRGGGGRVSEGCALGDPAAEGLVVLVVGAEAAAAAVRRPAAGLGQKQAVVGRPGEDAAAAGPLDDGVVVGSGGEA